MHLDIGTRLGPYEIDSLVGAGGMGEVYKARDTRLDRVVALKILSPVLAAHPDLRDRFEREARAISNVAHPNICTLFDLGRDSGTDFLVMEFLEGETLAARLERGALPFDHALSIAIDIVSALETAHRRGIVHRDLKPGNVMLVRRAGLSGTPVAKLLDFGLAKLAVEAPVAGASLVTAPQPLTQQGTILGTFQYMAPEQLEGAEADQRSDIFAFGAMFYEMLTGRRAFQGKSQASLIGAILKDQPAPVSAIQTVTPAAIDRIVARCLAKDPDERWQTASDLAAELKWVQQGGAHTASTTTPAGRAPLRRRELAAWILAGAAVTAEALSLLLASRPSAPAGAMRFTIDEPPEAPFSSAPIAPFPAISPDGKRLVFVSRGTGTGVLAMRSFESGAVQILTGTEGGNLPFWSPDSRLIGYVSAGKLQRYDVTTGTGQAMADAPGFEGGTWNRDGIVLYGSASGALFKVAPQGGRPEAVTTLNPAQGENSHRWPVFMPDGRHYVFVVQPGNRIRFGTLGSTETKDLVATDGRPIYSASGYLLYAVQSVLQARRFDPVRGEFDGDAIPIADNVRMLAQNTRATYSVSDSGILVYRPGNAASVSHLQWYDRAGKPQAEALPYGDNRSLSLSPDGTRVAFHRHDQGDGGGVWIKDLARGTVTRVTFNSHSFDEAWHPDGRHITFSMAPVASNVGAPASTATAEIATTTANGTGDVEHLVTSKGSNMWPNWSPDGKVLVYQVGSPPATNADIWMMPMDTRKAVAYIHGAANEGHPAFSPDGKWVAYTSDESGRPEIYVQPYPANGDKWTISTAGGVQPQWRGDGKELFFLTPSLQIAAVDINVKADRFDAGVPRPLFTSRALLVAGVMSPYRSYAVTRDGQAFLIIEPASEQAQRHDPLMVILNWTALLRR
jgi:eukaryotic-like serine/threonine-protein kinase